MRKTEIGNIDHTTKLITIDNYVWNTHCLATASDASPKLRQEPVRPRKFAENVFVLFVQLNKMLRLPSHGRWNKVTKTLENFVQFETSKRFLSSRNRFYLALLSIFTVEMVITMKWSDLQNER